MVRLGFWDTFLYTSADVDSISTFPLNCQLQLLQLQL